MSKRSEKERERIAYHEAGHAVMDILMALPFDEVSLRMEKREYVEIKNGKEETVTHAVTIGVTWPEHRRESENADLEIGKLDLRAAICSMAGPQAEAMFIGEVDDEANMAAATDMNGIVACCRVAISPGEPPEKWRESTMEGSLINALAEQAEEILKQNWPCVEAVAEALIKHRSLTYDEVKAIVDRKKGG